MDFSSIPMIIPKSSGTSRTSSESRCVMAGGSSVVVAGSYFSASSVNNRRNSVALRIPENDPMVEKKLVRTRKMSESMRNASCQSKKVSCIPTEKEDINKAWVFMVVNQYLLKIGNAPLDREQLEHLNFQVEDCKSSFGDFSTTYALLVDLANRGRLEFIVKMIPEDDACRAFVFETELFEKESEIYFNLLPAIKLHASKQHEVSNIVDKLVPECVHANHNMDGAGVLVFKSCSRRGYADCQDPNGFKLEQVRALIKSLAEFHAVSRSFVVKHGANGVKRRYPILSQDMYSNGMLLKEINECIAYYDIFLEHVDQSVSKVGLGEDDILEIKSQFEKLKKCDPYMVIKNLKRHCKQGKLTTIVHGELWDRNIMLDQSYNAKLLDWKNAKLASATLDLAFLMLSSTNSDVRDDSTEELLQNYYDKYTEMLDGIDSAIPKPTFDELKEDYDISLQFAALQALCMFVQEMHFMSYKIDKATEDKDFETVEDISDRLKVYEIRALTLFKDLDMSLIDEDENIEGLQRVSSLETPTFDEF